MDIKYKMIKDKEIIVCNRDKVIRNYINFSKQNYIHSDKKLGHQFC